ncbi:MAG: SMI1/KNR4 family protein [Planctomycetes bacterium]|nr:SMI1/KNR4 family protein [Planctomycetota bacterium]
MSGLTEHEIDEIEQALGLPLPSDVREQYRRSNGLLGPTDCHLLYSYKQSPESDILHNNEIRTEDWFPCSFKSVVLLGNDGVGNSICYDCASREAMLWNAADGDYVQERRATVKEVWAYIEAEYASL